MARSSTNDLDKKNTNAESVQTSLVAETPPVKDSLTTADQQKQISVMPPENKKLSSIPEKKSKRKHWYADIAATPLWLIQQNNKPLSLTRTLFSNNTLTVFSSASVHTVIDPAVAFSLSLRKEINQKTTVGIGLQYLQLKENVSISGNETNTHYSIVNRLVDGASGPELISDTVQTITTGKREITATNSYRLFSIPVFVQYSFIQKSSWSLGAVAGLYINVASRYHNEINRNATAMLTAKSGSSGDKTTTGIDIYGGLRVSKMINKRFELFAIPAIRWNLGGNNFKNSLNNKKIQQAGISFGVSFKMK